MCNYYVDLDHVSNYFNVPIDEVKEIIRFSESKFKDFISDELLVINGNHIKVNDKGRLFTRNISMRFDPLVEKNIGTYSKTI